MVEAQCFGADFLVPLIGVFVLLDTRWLDHMKPLQTAAREHERRVPLTGDALGDTMQADAT